MEGDILILLSAAAVRQNLLYANGLLEEDDDD
jgi:hypothetical protein